MAEVIGQQVDVLVTWSTPGATVAKKATSTVPIVALMGEPVRTGLVESLSRPGGNMTGLSMGFSEGMASKWLELLQELVPRLSTIAVTMNPDISVHRDIAKELQAIAQMRRVKLKIIEVREPAGLDSAFEQARRHAQAVLVIPDPVIDRARITSLAAKHRLPAMYGLRDFAYAGGLMAYAPDVPAMYRRAAEYVDKILKGAKPADLPIEQPTKFELVVNLKTAKALGITIPQSILLRADEVIP
jgi:putative ABC transport system substrate-binding protein